MSHPWGANKGFRQLARLELPGAGQVVVEGGYAYLGHMRPPAGTTIVDVRDVKHPKVVAQLEVPANLHSHKVRVANGLMLVNYEKYRPYQGTQRPQGGLKVFDVSRPERPRELAFVPAGEWGYHRFSFDGRYCYGSPAPEGYVGNILEILDLREPQRPEPVARWWVPGQWVGGGETPLPEGRRVRCHHPLRLGDRLYCSWWHHGWYIFDISDLARPTPIAHCDWSPPFPCPTHTTLPMPQPLKGRRILVVSDEEVPDRLAPVPNAFLWIVDISEETNPVPIATYRARPDDVPFDPQCWYGCHQPQEQVYDTRLAVTWFAGGLRLLDLADPWQPRELGYYVPLPGQGHQVTQSNDVFATPDGLYFLVDRLGGFEILEWVGKA
ncbi:MAG: hypothetical protein KatS3mg131_3223 [Candidatus Tectimicrobiota bacterium]|nr:MAG: hypothetical protein KatS3mg131_3223 [Candidatus Tectomicrobia bacterium]